MSGKDFIPLPRIEQQALALLAEYGRCIEPLTEPPVPVDDIFEAHLHFDFRFADLTAKYGGTNVLAEIFIKDKKVVVDKSLDPVEHPPMLGRYNFTLAHEIGHWVLHRNEVFAVSSDPDMFGFVSNPVICRDGSPEPHEWQANAFASNLLMPKEWVWREWLKIFPNGEPLNITDEMARKAEYRRMERRRYELTSDIARDMKYIFNVSGVAMHRRLCEMNLLEIGPHQPTLFDNASFPPQE